jgi:anti-anti-sigma factor
MTCAVETLEGVIRIRGEMTIYAAAALKDELFAALAANADVSSIDLNGVSELDTTGVQILMMASRLCESRGAALSFANPSVTAREALELLRVPGLTSPSEVPAP